MLTGNSYVVQFGYPDTGPWLPNASSSLSEWIGPVANQAPYTCCAGGTYTYVQDFMVAGSGTVFIAGRWAADDNAQMFLNGLLVSSTTSSFSGWTAFSFNAPTGADVLRFEVNNNANTPTGLRVEFDAGTPSAPEPFTMATLGAGLVAIGFLRRGRSGRP